MTDQKLTKDEQERLNNFNKLSDELRAEGYTDKRIIIDPKKANTLAYVITLPIMIIGAVPYFLLNKNDFSFNYPFEIFNFSNNLSQ